MKFPQVGGLVIGDYVEIGANCTIDRGALDETVIGAGHEARQPGAYRTQRAMSAPTS